MADLLSQYPKYEYTFEVTKILFESAQLEILYKPVDSRFTNFTYYVPMTADFDINDIKAFADRFAPFDRWFTQDMILKHENTILGASS
jgi:hypothetical protein